MLPLYFDNKGQAVFSTDQLDLYGLPEENGFTDTYWVIESPPILKYDFSTLQGLQNTGKKPVHRYDRFERFTTCLKQLLGVRGVIGKSYHDIQDIMGEEIFNYERQYMPPCLLWSRLRKVLSKHKKSNFCNRIPNIAHTQGFNINMPKISQRLYGVICHDFEEMHKIFPRIKHLLKRKYFPSIRGVCLLLMERYEVPNILNIPIAHTKTKAYELRNTFLQIWDEINKEMFDMIFN